MNEKPETQGPATARFISAQEAEIDRLKKQLRECESRHIKDIEHRTTLMEALRHEVRNNLAIVASMLAIHKRKQAADLEMVRSRIEALADLYKKVQMVDHHSEADFGDCLLELATKALHFHDGDGRAIRLDIQCEHLHVNTMRAAPLVLLANEILMNALKHAFPNRGGTITVRLHAIDDFRALLSISDDGVGFQHVDNGTVSHGLLIMKRLAAQAETDIVLESAETGVKISVVFLYSPRI